MEFVKKSFAFIKAEPSKNPSWLTVQYLSQLSYKRSELLHHARVLRQGTRHWTHHVEYFVYLYRSMFRTMWYLFLFQRQSMVCAHSFHNAAVIPSL